MTGHVAVPVRAITRRHPHDTDQSYWTFMPMVMLSWLNAISEHFSGGGRI